VTAYAPWDERERRQADDSYLDSLFWRTQDQRGPFYGGAPPETFFYDRMGPGPTSYACGSAPSGANPYGAARSPYTPLGGLEPIDIDAMLARMLEGYRILDELFNPRSVRTRPQAETENPRPATNQPRRE